MTDQSSAVAREGRFRKSSRSGSAGGNCVEIGRVDTTTFGVRDSKNPIGPVLAVDIERGHAFLHAIKSDSFTA
jgi:Domain of unknown function (DUF397)